MRIQRTKHTRKSTLRRRGTKSTGKNLAAAISDTGYLVGLLDADIWGFSVPRMVGATDQRLKAGDDRKIIHVSANKTGNARDEKRSRPGRWCCRALIR